jgi:16S rRNA processing protein RimM
MPSRLIVMGQVLAPFGVRGWLKIRPDTEAVGGLLEYRQWWLAPKGSDPSRPELWHSFDVVDGEAHHEHLVAELGGVAGREAAAALKGSLIAVPREALGESPRGEYFWADLVGLSVLNRRGEVLGEVSGLLSNGAHDVLRVGAADGRERLIPFVGAHVDEVDLPNRQIRVDWELDY